SLALASGALAHTFYGALSALSGLHHGHTVALAAWTATLLGVEGKEARVELGWRQAALGAAATQRKAVEVATRSSQNERALAPAECCLERCQRHRARIDCFGHDQ